MNLQRVQIPIASRSWEWPNTKTSELATMAPQATTETGKHLYYCRDSTFPGIGVHSVAACGAIVANSLVLVFGHSQLLDAIGI